MNLESVLGTFKTDVESLVGSGASAGHQLFTNFDTKVHSLIGDVQSVAGAVMSKTQLQATCLQIAKSASTVAAALAITAAQKKQYVMDAVMAAFDKLYPAIPLPWWAAELRTQYTAQARADFQEIADASIEFVYDEVVAPALAIAQNSAGIIVDNVEVVNSSTGGSAGGASGATVIANPPVTPAK